MTAPAKRGPGRPRLPPTEARHVRLYLKLTDAEREAVGLAAAGREVSVWARETLLRAARRRM